MPVPGPSPPAEIASCWAPPARAPPGPAPALTAGGTRRTRGQPARWDRRPGPRGGAAGRAGRGLCGRGRSWTFYECFKSQRQPAMQSDSALANTTHYAPSACYHANDDQPLSSPTSSSLYATHKNCRGRSTVICHAGFCSFSTHATHQQQHENCIEGHSTDIGKTHDGNIHDKEEEERHGLFIKPLSPRGHT